MRKIPTLFVRDFDHDGELIDEVNPECRWVFRGLGVPTYKWDGKAVKLSNKVWYVRKSVENVTESMYRAYMGTASINVDGFPTYFKLESYDNYTNKAFGWVPVTGTRYEKYLVEALRNHGAYWIDGTFELIGPEIKDNRHHLEKHFLKRHGIPVAGQVPISFEELREYLVDFRYEGIVWYGVDGSMAKVKRRDFGLE